MTVRKAAMVGCDEGKPHASARAGGETVRVRTWARSSAPGGSGAQDAAAARSPGERRARLADVVRHGVSAGRGLRPVDPKGGAKRQKAAPFDRGRNIPCRRRSRSRHSWASSRRRSAVSWAQIAALRIKRRISLTFGTNRELSEIGLAEEVRARSRPALTAARLQRKTSSRRREGSRQRPRRRDARPVRSGGRREGWSG